MVGSLCRFIIPLREILASDARNRQSELFDSEGTDVKDGYRKTNFIQSKTRI